MGGVVVVVVWFVLFGVICVRGDMWCLVFGVVVVVRCLVIDA